MTVDLGSSAPLGTGDNWVTRNGGLPPKVREIARALMRKGMSKSRAIAVAINVVKRTAATGDLNFPGLQHAKASTVASHAGATAQWEALKARAHSHTAPPAAALDLAIVHQPAGSPKGGQFAPASGTTNGDGKTADAKTAEQLRDFQKRTGLKQTGLFDKATTARIAKLRGPKGGGKGGSAAKKAAAAKTKADRARKAAAAKAAREQAKKDRAAKVAQAKFARASAAAARQQTAAEAKQAAQLAAALNRATPEQRAAYLAAKGVPAGWAVDGKGKLTPAASAAADQAVVAPATAGTRTTPSGYTVPAALPPYTPIAVPPGRKPDTAGRPPDHPDWGSDPGYDRNGKPYPAGHPWARKKTAP